MKVNSTTRGGLPYILAQRGQLSRGGRRSALQERPKWSNLTARYWSSGECRSRSSRLIPSVIQNQSVFARGWVITDETQLTPAIKVSWRPPSTVDSHIAPVPNNFRPTRFLTRPIAAHAQGFLCQH